MIDAIEQRIGWTFTNKALLWQALTHSTYANEHPEAGADNERLEFLGDAVLNLLAAHLMYDGLPEAGEGEMSRRRARVVRGTSLAAMARTLELGKALRMGQGQSRSGETDSILADTYEAVIGAVFLDGGYEAVQKCFTAPLLAAIEAAQHRMDFKTTLQELCHARGLTPPRYTVVEVSGPDHAREFRCAVMVGSQVMGEGVGSSKRAAEQVAAAAALQAMEEERPGV